jgi:hypothetical protein
MQTFITRRHSSFTGAVINKVPKKFNIYLKYISSLAIPFLVCSSASTAEAVLITTFSDRNNFNAAVGTTPLIVEDFTDTSHFPISTGILNSQTDITVESGPPIKPGDIEPGVTYSTPIGSSNFFNIDAGGGLIGGFLDGFFGGNPNRVLTIDFDNSVSAFGFDTNFLMGSNFDLTIKFESGLDFVQNFLVNESFNEVQFFGFQSNEVNIESVVIDGNGNNLFAFALDNFTFTNSQDVTIPEPSLVLGLLAFSAFSAASKKMYRKHYR